MLNAAQLEARKNGLGGSDIAALMGMNPYKTEYELYLEKVGDLPAGELSSNEAVLWGNLLEDTIAKRYAEVTGKEIYCCDTVVHPNHSFLLANPDRLIKGEKRGLEIKNVGLRMSHLWGDAGSHIIPEYHFWQIAHYMMVLDYDSWDVAALIGGNELRIYTFERDRDFDEAILAAATTFWNDHVLVRQPPAPDWNHSSSGSLLKKMHPAVNDQEVELPEEINGWVNIWLQAKEAIKAYQGVVDGAQAHILAMMKDAGTGRLKDGSCFIRKLIKVKSYTVAANEYVTFNYKKAMKSV